MSEPILTVLSYSAGVQSHCLLEMVLRGDIERPKKFIVLNADPGMEDSRSYEFVQEARWKCFNANIDFITAAGGDLKHDLLTFKSRGLERLETPPYWTKNRETGKRGKLGQRCTGFYKIDPMKRELRRYLNINFGISLVSKRLPKVVMWIGFALDEVSRCEESRVGYIVKKYPLIEKQMDRAKVEGYYLKNGIEKPPRSVCIACFANGLSHFEDMYNNRPDDWDIAIAVDEAVRDMRPLGITDEVFVSSSLVPLRDLPGMNFKKYDGDYREHRCNSGVCFL